MPDRDPFHVLIAGGGPAAIEAALRLHRIAPDVVRTTILAPERDYVARPMTVLEPFAAGHAERRPLRELAQRAQAEVVQGRLASIDAAGQAVTTDSGDVVAYDGLLITVGARAEATEPHVIAFGAPGAGEQLHGAIQDMEEGYLHAMAFVVPEGVRWSLPIYELALMTAQRAWESGQRPRLTLVTPESAPLELFGEEASRLTAAALADAGVDLRTSAHAGFPAPGVVELAPGGSRLEVQRVVTLPRLRGPELPGLPLDEDGFVRCDQHGRVHGLDDVWAAGDATSFPIKQGGLACQQADAAAASIAAEAGAGNDPQPFEPVLRGVLITERSARFLRDGEAVTASAMWWPPTKIAGEELIEVLEDIGTMRRPTPGGAPVEVRLPVHAL
jgi:sulfide:quinone oxidoreductase